MKNSFFLIVVLFSASMVVTSCRTEVAVRPAPAVIARPPAPAAGFVWVNGGWYRSRGLWVQRPGYWMKPRPARIYVSVNPAPGRRGYYSKNGYWR